jgi:hypothetical protein
MALKDDYQRIAERSLLAGSAALNAQVQEKAAFLCYHAFESSGCAFSAKNGRPIGPRISHDKKLNIFTNEIRVFRSHTSKTYRDHYHLALKLSIRLRSLRNDCLYPIQNPTTKTFARPDVAISQAQAHDLLRQVRQVVLWVGALL